MKRRQFISTGIKAGIVAGMVPVVSAGHQQQKPFDLVAVKGGEPGAMFDMAIRSLGGLSAFVMKGQTVLVKPNIGWDAPPERAANTNAGLVKKIVALCVQQGAKKVIVFDKTCNDWNKCYKNSGIQQAVTSAGGIMLPGNSEQNYKPVTIPGAVKLKGVKVHEAYISADVIINVPVLKHHSGTTLTIGMKNLMGVVWDRWFWHEHDLHRCIAEFVLYRKPTLNVVDAHRVIMRNGPRGVSVEDVTEMNSLIVSRDIVAADAAATKLFGKEPDEIGHIKIAHNLKLGSMLLDKLNIDRIKMG